MGQTHDETVKENRELRELLTYYVKDEIRFQAGEGEPYGSIPTEVGIAARRLTNLKR